MNHTLFALMRWLMLNRVAQINSLHFVGLSFTSIRLLKFINVVQLEAR